MNIFKLIWKSLQGKLILIRNMKEGNDMQLESYIKLHKSLWM